MTGTLSRRNLIDCAEEDFRPPQLKPNTSTRNRVENWLRRFLDLQAGSAWRDLRVELAGARGRLIDVGCGAQVYRDLLPADVDYLGIDTIEAKAKFGYDMPDTRYFQGPDWGVPDGAFDIALCTEVLEHVTDPASFVALLHRCLRPGGRLVLTVPFAARWHFIPYDYWRYTPSGLGLLLAAAGFREVQVRARGNPLTVACYKSMALCLSLLFTPGHAARRMAGIALLPMLTIFACVANLTLAADWGDDCLGYTVTARRDVTNSS